MANIKNSEHKPDIQSEALKERTKELKCLYSLTSISNDHELSLDDLLQRAVEFIPLGFQYPEIGCAKISYKNRSYKTDNCRKSKWRLASPINVSGKDVGSVEVFYSKNPSANTKDPFLKEERELILSIGSQLGVTIENKVLYEELIIRDKAISSAIVGIAYSDLKHKLIYVNDAFIKMWGYEHKSEILGRHGVEFWKQKKELYKVIRRVTQKRAYTGELVGLKKDGTTFDVFYSVHIVTDRFGNPICRMGFFHDITEHKRADAELENSQKELRSLTSHLQNLREQERKRMAHRIHDELGQELTVLKMNLDLLKDKLPKDQKDLLDLTGSMMKTLNKTARTVQRMSTELRPRLLDDIGLIPAMEWYIKEFQKHTGIKCEFITDDGDINPDTKTSTVLFRVLQEALTNTARHADATRIKISLTAKPDKLILKIRDNGKGITQNQITSSNSFGILGIRESVLSLRGQTEIKGIPDKSTTIKVSLPLDDRV